MKFIKMLLILVLLSTFSEVKGLDRREVNNWEGGLSFGPTFGLKPDNSYTGKVGANVSIDLRYNFKNSGWDIGASVIANVVTWDILDKNNDIREENNNNTAVVVTGHYNFLQGKKFNPFIGFGFGVSDIHSDNDMLKLSKSGAIFCPTIGIEMFYHIRINAGFYLSRSGFNSFALSAGFVIGGRPKKAPKTE